MAIPTALTVRCSCGSTRIPDRLRRTFLHVGAGRIEAFIDASDKCPICRTFASTCVGWPFNEDGRCVDCDTRVGSHRDAHPVTLLHDPIEDINDAEVLTVRCVCGWESDWPGAPGWHRWWQHMETVRTDLIRAEGRVHA